jgi:acetate kinase
MTDSTVVHALRLQPPCRAVKISTDESRLAAYVVAADEETWIANETVRCVRGVCSS